MASRWAREFGRLLEGWIFFYPLEHPLDRVRAGILTHKPRPNLVVKEIRVAPLSNVCEELGEILPIQQLAWRMALDRGLDPDQPRGLSKVTETW